MGLRKWQHCGAGKYGSESWVHGLHSRLDHASGDHLWLSLHA